MPRAGRRSHVDRNRIGYYVAEGAEPPETRCFTHERHDFVSRGQVASRLLWHDGGHAYLKHNSFGRPAIREIKLRKALGGSRVAAG